MNDRTLANQIVESLRRGIPPARGVAYYSVGCDQLLEAIRRLHLSSLCDHGKIRFISGSWGSGKTHFMRLLEDTALDLDCLVSSVQLGKDDAALNRFETAFAEIVRGLRTQAMRERDTPRASNSLEIVLEETLGRAGRADTGADLHAPPLLAEAERRLMADSGIDIDFRKMVAEYWRTYAPEGEAAGSMEQIRGEIAQWFCGDGTAPGYRKRFGVNKVVSKDNARLMLSSLSRFAQLVGYAGLVVLFDEAEASYSVLRRSQLRDAQNTLLALINGIAETPGLFLVYATTPDFYDDPKYGIESYGALAQRIGRPSQEPPRALSTVWNLDAQKVDLASYQDAAQRVLKVYQVAYPPGDYDYCMPTPDEVCTFIRELFEQHSSADPMRFWRVAVQSLVAWLDAALERRVVDAQQTYRTVMERFRDE